MKLTELQAEWEKDSVIDNLDLGEESLKISRLHSKYVTLLSNGKLSLRKAESNYLNARRLKYRFYRGEMTRQELEEQGWTQYQGLKPVKAEMEQYLMSDEDLLQLEDKVEYFKVVVYTLEQIIRSLYSRSYDIKNKIEWTKYTNGQ